MHLKDVYIYRNAQRDAPLLGRCSRAAWPLHDIAITNVVWYILQERGQGVNNIVRDSVGDTGRGWSAQPVGVFARNISDSCT